MVVKRVTLLIFLNYHYFDDPSLFRTLSDPFAYFIKSKRLHLMFKAL